MPHTVVVVDNACTDGTAALLAAHPEVPGAPERGATSASPAGRRPASTRDQTPFVALLNNDAVAEPGWLAALVQGLDAHPRRGRRDLADAPRRHRSARC